MRSSIGTFGHIPPIQCQSNKESVFFKCSLCFWIVTCSNILRTSAYYHHPIILMHPYVFFSFFAVSSNEAKGKELGPRQTHQTIPKSSGTASKGFPIELPTARLVFLFKEVLCCLWIAYSSRLCSQHFVLVKSVSHGEVFPDPRSAPRCKRRG